MKFFVICHLVAGNLYKVAAPYFLIFYIVQPDKEVVQSCRYIALSGHSSPQYQTIVHVNRMAEIKEGEEEIPVLGHFGTGFLT